MSKSTQTIQLIPKPKSQNVDMIGELLHIHHQQQKYAIGDPNVGKFGGSKLRVYRATGKGKKLNIYARNPKESVLVAFELFSGKRVGSFNFQVGGVRYYGIKRTHHGAEGRFSNHITPRTPSK